jgi:hypothetical protein
MIVFLKPMYLCQQAKIEMLLAYVQKKSYLLLMQTFLYEKRIASEL